MTAARLTECMSPCDDACFCAVWFRPPLFLFLSAWWVFAVLFFCLLSSLSARGPLAGSNKQPATRGIDGRPYHAPERDCRPLVSDRS